ncbi:MAG: hypothetical protein R2877_04440 [Bdellovibrionota bacterium]
MRLKQPNAVILCLYGDLHIASKHIPQVNVFSKEEKAKRSKPSRFSKTAMKFTETVDQQHGSQSGRR